MALFMWKIQSRSPVTDRTADFRSELLLSFLPTTEVEGFQNKMQVMLDYQH